MAFVLSGFSRVSSSKNSDSTILWAYKSTTDTVATIAASGYFDSISGRLPVNTRIIIEGTDDLNELVVTGTGPVTTDKGEPQKVSFNGAISGAIFGAADIEMVRDRTTVTYLIKLENLVSGGGPAGITIDGSATPVDFLAGPSNNPTQIVQVTDDTTDKIGLIQINGTTGNIGFSTDASVFTNFAGGGSATGWSAINGSYVITIV